MTSPSISAAPSVADCFFTLWRNPQETLLRRWNWKASLFSSLCRGGLFFAVNAGAGLEAALGAMYAEFAYRSVTAGFYGAITQQFRRAAPRWLAASVVGMGVPLVSHAIEFTVHWLRGTPHLQTSIAASVGFTVISTLFNLHAMREGILVVGDGGGSLFADLRSLPRVIFSFVMPNRTRRG
jgi:hypothetical protein